MRVTLLSLCLLVLPGCSLLSGPDAERAWVDLQSAADNRLVTLELDGSPWRKNHFRLRPAPTSWRCATSSTSIPATSAGTLPTVAIAG